eukprot:jgi/Psemu1/222248/e_gw1.1199.1.1
MPLLGTAFSMGSSGTDNGIGKSLDDMIADRRKEQARASTGRNAGKGNKNTKTTDANNKKTAVADRSIATGRAKRAAATRARRGLAGGKADNNNNNNKTKPSAMEIEKEVYRQSRKTAESKKKAEQKKTNGRLPPNSTLRSKKKNNSKASNNNESNDHPGIVTGKQPSKKQIKAALQGMETAGCPIPTGYQIMVQFIPPAVAPSPAKGKAAQTKARKTAGGKGGRGGKK